MNRDFNNYKIFSADEKTKIQTFLDNKLVEEVNFTNISQKNLKNFISQNTLFLENGFIKNLNLKNLTNSLDNIILKNCFLIYDEQFDLSDLDLNNLTIEKTILIANEINFKNITVNKLNFSYSYFKTKNFNFSNSTVKQKNVNFKALKFSEGTKDFSDTKFLQGEINFSLVDFNDGNVIFQDCFFGKGRVNFTMANFGKGKKDFVRAKFSEGEKIFERTNFGEGNLTFRNADFGKGTVNFRRAIFGKGEISFLATHFDDGNIKFTSSEFNGGKLNFRLTEFGNGIKDFHYSIFGDTDIIFDRTKFSHGDIDFKAADFGNSRITFNRILIKSGSFIFEGIEKKGGTITFKNSFLSTGKFIFDSAKASNTTLAVEETNFGTGKISFYYAIFDTIILHNTQINNYCDLRVQKVNKLIIKNSVVRDVLDLNSAEFIPEIKYFDFSGLRLLGRIFISWEDLNLKKLIYQQDTSYSTKAEQFRILKENFRNNGQYDEEDLAYVEFKRLESKAKLLKKIQKNPKLKFFYYFQYYTNDLIMDKLGAYATNPFRVLFSMTVIYLFFSLLYFIIEITFPNNGQIISSLFPENDPRVLSNFAKALYHSAITFLTIGYGDYYPDGINRWLSAIEGFIGLFMMSYFTVAFVRKILR